MPLLELKGIGKIYVSENNVTVGIRGVDLAFDKGEFVAVTGKSGSGKSTLLNVISGMDSYEEGELLIEGMPTSHYLEPDWERYREEYISFVFQDYNIIDSFTVLENVELALMHIEDKTERRARALELVGRVGLLSHVSHKGSRLSGGQKQRTVIARALAKDSPIILADEPTGNLDSATSREIIELLSEISKDKLLIVVTHDFDELADYATRHVRIYDGAVESDHILREHESEPSENKSEPAKSRDDKKVSLKKDIRNGFILGADIFRSKPRLTVFLCLLMLIGTIGIFLVTSLTASAGENFEPRYMFRHIDGRVVVVRRDGAPMTADDVKKLSEEYGADADLRFDALIDMEYANGGNVSVGNTEEDMVFIDFEFTYSKSYSGDMLGGMPEKKNEVFLYIPITYQPIFGKNEIEKNEISINNVTYRISGIKYFYDNNKRPECLLTYDGFRTATAAYYLASDYSSLHMSLAATNYDTGSSESFKLANIVVSFDMPADKVYIDSASYKNFVAKNDISKCKQGLSIIANYYVYDYIYGTQKNMYFSRDFDESAFTYERPDAYPTYDIFQNTKDYIIISDELLCEIAEGVLDASYRQASLFFENDTVAGEKADLMSRGEYIAVPSYTTHTTMGDDAMLQVLEGMLLVLAWLLSIMFLAFFINLCSSRSLAAFRGDMAIMRSMGIPVRVIRIGMHVRMLMSLIPAFVFMAAFAAYTFLNPVLNDVFVYLYAWQYALIALGMIILTYSTTRMQVKRLFGASVKKSLKGGSEE